jgi:flagellin-like protein
VQHPSKLRLRRSRGIRGKRGVSEVVGTILILALTVVLFSSIFFFVNTFPKPATQPTSQFQGQLYYSYAASGTHTWTNVSHVTITHLGGPVITGFNTQIYVVSQAHPQNTTAVYNLTSGGLGSGNSVTWGTGQIWNLSLVADHLTIPDNITVTVVANGVVVYRQTLPGTNPTIPPIFDQEGTSPSNPGNNSPFSVFVQITDPFLRTTSTAVYLNLTTPGMTCGTALSTYPATTGEYRFVYNSTNGLWFVNGCSASSTGTYYVTAWATDSNPIQVQQNSIIFPVAIGTSGSGGGTGGTGPSGCSVSYTTATGFSPKTPADSGAVVLYLNVSVLASSTPSGNACAWIYFSGNYTGTVTANEGTYTPTTPTQVTDKVMQVGLTTAVVTELTASWTAPAKSCNPGGHSTCTGTATITFTISYASGATGVSTVTWSIAY